MAEHGIFRTKFCNESEIECMPEHQEVYLLGGKEHAGIFVFPVI